ncbi:hypothetical protein MT325_m534R [Paramecium bursaria chlorella virus MT325]|uniref:Uncharacterized protein m534R n=1 Tax=Paramecium bursaria Chlorella virus MT325 TaxID=346932 RepID=A7IUR4_PBCVM|nr:hypothetical protein MT325_m534R [Paramecium bursaria chlorella virus MT325]
MFATYMSDLSILLDVIIVEPAVCENNDSMHKGSSRAHCDRDTPHIGSNLLDFEEFPDKEHDDDLEGNKAKHAGQSNVFLENCEDGENVVL